MYLSLMMAALGISNMYLYVQYAQYVRVAIERKPLRIIVF
jgi:hypothetical protein